MRALQLNPPSCWGPAVRKGTSGRGHKVARVPAALPTGNSSVSRGAGWAPNAHLRPEARPGSETASVNARPAGGSRPARRPRPGRPVPSRPGAPFPSVPRRRPRPALPGLTQQQEEQRPPGAGGRHGATQPRPGCGGCEAGGRARPPTREAPQLRRRHRGDPAAGSACHVSSAAPAGHVSRGGGGGLARASPAAASSPPLPRASASHVMRSHAGRCHVTRRPRDAWPSALFPGVSRNGK